MIHRHRDELVEARAHMILADELATAAYADYFEAQMRSGKVRKLLSRTGKVLLAMLAFLFSGLHELEGQFRVSGADVSMNASTLLAACRIRSPSHGCQRVKRH